VPIHDAAARGFETSAAAYERSRPDYPAAALEAMLGALRLPPGGTLLDVGAGTGKLSRCAAERGVRVLAVEPVSAMRRRLAGITGVIPLGGTAEALPLREAAVSAAVAATAFHWFDVTPALRELHRVLRPGGRLALVWNRRDDAVDWVARLTDIVNEAETPGAPRYHTGRWRDAFREAPGLFGPLEEAHFPHVHRLSPEGVVERIASVSFVAAMPEPARTAVLDRVRALLASHPATAGRTELGLAYVTDLFWCERR
jgi:SAM-dependent methyltransferase